MGEMTLVNISVLSSGEWVGDLGHASDLVDGPARSTENASPPAIALSRRVPGIAEGGGRCSGSKAPVPNLIVFLVNLVVGRGVDICREDLRLVLLICIPAAGKVTLLSCTWLSFGFECDHPPRLNGDKRELPAITDSTEARVEMYRGNVASSAVTS